MNLIEDNLFTQTYRRLGKELPRPSAILAVSAHWVTERPCVTDNQHPKQIFDFYGFPQELYQIVYTPPGDPQLAKTLVTTVPEIHTSSEWGLDHGTWAILQTMYPLADIPVLQLSLGATLTEEEHFALGIRLSFLRKSGVLIMASGNLVHNLGEVRWSSKAPAHSWAERFEDDSIRILLDNRLSAVEKAAAIFQISGLDRAHPSPEHLIPLLYVLAATSEENRAQVEVRGIQNASVSMATLRFG